jgi:malonyl-CoA O-methyltransferase
MSPSPDLMDEPALHWSQPKGAIFEALQAGQRERQAWMRLPEGAGLAPHSTRVLLGPSAEQVGQPQVGLVCLPVPSLELLAQPLRLWASALAVGGVLMVSSLGPGTLIEWRKALGLSPDAWPRGLDLHDLGDLLSQSGLSAPVTESERVTWTYRHFQTAWNDLRGLWLAPAGSGLQPRSCHKRAQATFEGLRASDGRVSLTFEWVHAHAWRGEPRRGAQDSAKPLTFQAKGRFG